MNEPIFLIQLEGDRYYLSDTDKEGWEIEIGCSLGNQKRLRLRSQERPSNFLQVKKPAFEPRSELVFPLVSGLGVCSLHLKFF